MESCMSTLEQLLARLPRIGGHLLMISLLAIPSAGQNFRVFHYFTDPEGAADPYAPLLQATDGNLYGTTSRGGGVGHTAGEIYRLTPASVFTDIHDFCSQPDCTDGARPVTGLIQGTDGYLYGVTVEGGINGGAKCNPTGFCGTVFRVSLDGAFTTLYQFCSQPDCTDGYGPSGRLLQA